MKRMGEGDVSERRRWETGQFSLERRELQGPRTYATRMKMCYIVYKRMGI